jgi:hypothetical protein
MLRGQQAQRCGTHSVCSIGMERSQREALSRNNSVAREFTRMNANDNVADEDGIERSPIGEVKNLGILIASL